MTIQLTPPSRTQPMNYDPVETARLIAMPLPVQPYTQQRLREQLRAAHERIEQLERALEQAAQIAEQQAAPQPSGAAPDAYMFTARIIGKGRTETFAAIDYTPAPDEAEILDKQPLYLAAPSPAESGWRAIG